MYFNISFILICLKGNDVCPWFVFLFPKKPSHCLFVKSDDFHFFPQTRTAQLRNVEFKQHRPFTPISGSLAYVHRPQKRFAQHRLRKLNPPSSNIVKYSFSLQPIMNNSFILQPIIFNPKFSSNQQKSPKNVRKWICL